MAVGSHEPWLSSKSTLPALGLPGSTQPSARIQLSPSAKAMASHVRRLFEASGGSVNCGLLRGRKRAPGARLKSVSQKLVSSPSGGSSRRARKIMVNRRPASASAAPARRAVSRAGCAAGRSTASVPPAATVSRSGKAPIRDREGRNSRARSPL